MIPPSSVQHAAFIHSGGRNALKVLYSIQLQKEEKEQAARLLKLMYTGLGCCVLMRE